MPDISLTCFKFPDISRFFRQVVNLFLIFGDTKKHRYLQFAWSKIIFPDFSKIIFFWHFPDHTNSATFSSFPWRVETLYLLPSPKHPPLVPPISSLFPWSATDQDKARGFVMLVLFEQINGDQYYVVCHSPWTRHVVQLPMHHYRDLLLKFLKYRKQTKDICVASNISVRKLAVSPRGLSLLARGCWPCQSWCKKIKLTWYFKKPVRIIIGKK